MKRFDVPTPPPPTMFAKDRLAGSNDVPKDNDNNDNNGNNDNNDDNNNDDNNINDNNNLPVFTNGLSVVSTGSVSFFVPYANGSKL